MKRKLMALLVAAMMLTTLLPLSALAAGNEQPLEHTGHYACTHDCSDGTCSYVAAVEGVEGTEGTPCDFVCSEELAEGESCTCSHVCGDGSCSYEAGTEGQEAVEGTPCDHDCAAAGCTWVCDSDCPACAAENEGKTEEPKTETPEQPAANNVLGGSPTVLNVEDEEDPSYIQPTDLNDPVLDSILQIEPDGSTSVVVLPVADGQTLDFSNINSIPSRVDGNPCRFEVRMSGQSTFIGSGNSYRRFGIQLQDGADAVIRDCLFFIDNGISVAENASAALRLEGTVSMADLIKPCISVPDSSSLLFADSTLNGIGTNKIQGGTITFQNSVIEGTSIAGNVTMENSTVTLSGGAPCLNGAITIANSDVRAEAANYKPAVSGTIDLLSGSLTAAAASSSSSPSSAVEDATLHIAEGAAFHAFASEKVPAIDPAVEINGTVLTGRLAPSENAVDFCVNGGPVISPTAAADRSFAVSVEPADTYTIGHRFGLSHLELPDGNKELSINEENLGLVWIESDFSDIDVLKLEAGNIVIGSEAITYGPVTLPADLSQTIVITQDAAKATPNNITVEDGVAAAIELRDIHIDTSKDARVAPIAVGANASLDITLPEGTSNTLKCGYGTAGIELKDGCSLNIAGDGALRAEATDGDSAGIGVVYKSAGYYPASSYPVVTIGGNADVTAIGYSGAGIGSANSSGSYDACRVVIKDNATVYAEGGNESAGIGGGRYSNGTNVRIQDNANVTAIGGGNGAAAIGGGQCSSDSRGGGHAGQITITGAANVTAISMSGGAAIGRGLKQDNTKIDPDETDSIVIDTTGVITAYALGNTQPTMNDGKYYFAIDPDIAAVTVPILNARFTNQFQGQSNPVGINVIRKADNKTIALTLPSAYSTCHAFATTVELLNNENTVFMVQDGRQNAEAQFADFGSTPNAEGDSGFLYTVGSTMTTRDDLAFEAFTIQATTDGNGTITPAGDAAVAPRHNATFTFQGNTGYVVDKVTVDGETVAVNGNTYTFGDVQADHTIHVTFKAAPASSYTITATAGGNGSITPAGDSTVEAGKDATFTFSPNSGYAVDVVTVDGEAVAVTGNSYTFANVHSNHTIHVTFKYVGGGGYDDDDDDDDDDTPPEVIVDPEIPLAQPEVPGETEEIADPEVPLANLPEEPATDVPEETVEENDVPLANLPKTGGLTGLGIGAAGLATILTGMNLRKKEK